MEALYTKGLNLVSVKFIEVGKRDSSVISTGRLLNPTMGEVHNVLSNTKIGNSGELLIPELNSSLGLRTGVLGTNIVNGWSVERFYIILHFSQQLASGYSEETIVYGFTEHGELLGNARDIQAGLNEHNKIFINRIAKYTLNNATGVMSRQGSVLNLQAGTVQENNKPILGPPNGFQNKTPVVSETLVRPNDYSNRIFDEKLSNIGSENESVEILDGSISDGFNFTNADLQLDRTYMKQTMNLAANTSNEDVMGGIYQDPNDYRNELPGRKTVSEFTWESPFFMKLITSTGNAGSNQTHLTTSFIDSFFARGSIKPYRLVSSNGDDTRYMALDPTIIQLELSSQLLEMKYSTRIVEILSIMMQEHDIISFSGVFSNQDNVGGSFQKNNYINYVPLGIVESVIPIPYQVNMQNADNMVMALINEFNRLIGKLSFTVSITVVTMGICEIIINIGNTNTYASTHSLFLESISSSLIGDQGTFDRNLNTFKELIGYADKYIPDHNAPTIALPSPTYY